MNNDNMHTISVLVQNKFGVLARGAGLFSGRGYNISSLTVTATNNPDISKMTIVTCGDAQILEQIDKQLRKLVDVISVTDLTGSRFVERELVLVKVKAETAAKKAELIQIVQIFGAKFVTVNKKELGIELSGRSNVIDNFIDMVKDFGIVDLARSGRVAVAKE